jgi:hypothetical protein
VRRAPSARPSLPGREGDGRVRRSEGEAGAPFGGRARTPSRQQDKVVPCAAQVHSSLRSTVSSSQFFLRRLRYQRRVIHIDVHCHNLSCDLLGVTLREVQRSKCRRARGRLSRTQQDFRRRRVLSVHPLPSTVLPLLPRSRHQHDGRQPVLLSGFQPAPAVADAARPDVDAQRPHLGRPHRPVRSPPPPFRIPTGAGSPQLTLNAADGSDIAS